jgi:hypothetical protein
MQQEKATGDRFGTEVRDWAYGRMPVHRPSGAGAFAAAALLLAMMFMAAPPAFADTSSFGKSYVKPLDAPGKYLMHLEGTPYQIGYAMGRMRPRDVVRLVRGEYLAGMLSLALPVLDKGLRPVQGAAIDALLRMPGVQRVLDTMARDVPYEYRLEMKGIVDGTNAALRYRAVTYYHVLVVNLFPALQAVVTSSPLTDTLSACHGFVAFGDATRDGRTLMGRHFMWVAEPLHEITCVAEYVPARGRRFVSVTFPGMVGLITGVNSAGIGCGTDFFNATGSPSYPSGLGMWFLGRKVVQYASTISEAERIIRQADEVAPCFVLVGDAAGAGAVFEVYDHKVSKRSAAWVPTHPDTPDPIEMEDDLVVVSNHAFMPEMFPIDQFPANSLTRYEILTSLVLGSYGSLDEETGRAAIDFMHPPSPYLTGAYQGYGADPAQPVKQHVALLDLSTRTLWALYGHYSDPWVRYTLQ